MKHLIVCLFMLIGTATQLRAQDVFYSVVNNASLVIEDPRADAFLVSVCQFKYTAMRYLCNKAIKESPNGEVPATLLDQQAASMNNFVTSYFSELAKAQGQDAAAQKKILRKYWEASASHPLFNDPDKETTQAFINDPECITPFSLDTDWVSAEEAVKK